MVVFFCKVLNSLAAFLRVTSGTAKYYCQFSNQLIKSFETSTHMPGSGPDLIKMYPDPDLEDVTNPADAVLAI